MTECPDTEEATSFELVPASSHASRMALEIAGAFMKDPCTIASDGNAA